MFSQAKKRLILLFMVSTGSIFTIALLSTLNFMKEQKQRNQMTYFQSIFYSVAMPFEQENFISYLTLSELEIKDKLLIYIEDNKKPLTFPGVWKPLTEREKLIEQLRKKAKKEDIDPSQCPISVRKITSKAYRIEGDFGDLYLGKIYIVAKDKGFRSLFLLQSLNHREIEEMEPFFFFLMIELLGLLALFGISNWIINKALKPVQNSKKKQDEFIAAASHELRSPLAVIQANLAAMKREPKQLEYFLSGIEKESKRMARLIEDMLLLASAEGNWWNIKMEKIETDTLLIEVYDTFYSYCKEHQMELVMKLPQEMLPPIWGDRERLKQVLAILIDNAISYGKKTEEKLYEKEGEPQIQIGAEVRNHKVFLWVMDHGVGIAKEKQKDIFERFYRVEKGRKEKEHFGLGLSIAKELLQVQNGRIRLMDTEGGGCTFLLEFSLRESAFEDS